MEQTTMTTSRYQKKKDIVSLDEICRALDLMKELPDFNFYDKFKRWMLSLTKKRQRDVIKMFRDSDVECVRYFFDRFENEELKNKNTVK